MEVIVGKTNQDFIDDTYYSYGYYFGEITVDPSNENIIYVMGVPLLKSLTVGKPSMLSIKKTFMLITMCCG